MQNTVGLYLALSQDAYGDEHREGNRCLKNLVISLPHMKLAENSVESAVQMRQSEHIWYTVKLDRTLPKDVNFTQRHIYRGKIRTGESDFRVDIH